MMNNKKVQKVNYITNFNRKNQRIYTSKCDFEIENAKLDFNKCPIIAELSAKGIEHRLDINSIISVDINLGIPDSAILPASLLKPASICEKCRLKHRERGED